MFVRALVRRYSNETFCLFADPRCCKAYEGEPNLYLTSKVGYLGFRILKKLGITSQTAVHRLYSRHTDAVVKIGGSIFIEPENWTDGQRYVAAYEKAKKLFYIGANFGPYTSESFMENVKQRIAKSTDCCFRDTYSRDVFSMLGNVRCAPDVLFGYQDYPAKKEGSGIGISVISLSERKGLEKHSDEYCQTIAQLCDICHERNIPVTLFSFCEAEGDTNAVTEIMSRMIHKDSTDYCIYKGNLDTFLNKMNERKYWIATRFHAMILGWSMGKAVLPVIYSKKQTNVISDVGYTGAVWNLLSGELCSAEQLLSNCMNNKTICTERFKLESEKQFAGLDAFVRK